MRWMTTSHTTTHTCAVCVKRIGALFLHLGSPSLARRFCRAEVVLKQQRIRGVTRKSDEIGLQISLLSTLYESKLDLVIGG
jgi:hypothetical protein